MFNFQSGFSVFSIADLVLGQYGRVCSISRTAKELFQIDELVENMEMVMQKDL